MKIADYFFSSHWINALGWTLIHSLWQALIVVSIVILLVKLIPQSGKRYLVACLGMGVIVVSAILTYIVISGNEVVNTTTFSNSTVVFSSAGTHHTQSVPSSFPIINYVEANMGFIVFAWLAGAFLFSLRMMTGWFYINRIRLSAIPITNGWDERLAKLAAQLSIKRLVQIAESTRIHSPMVIGFLKPMILIPAGMLSGLTTEQVEAILIHELAHIKRHDYFINILQSVIEIILFFNPFVWTLSAVIRREREYCCDDAVITKQKNKLAYVHALASLEEARISKNALAMSLAGNKNELLTRIKRIMEKPFQQSSKSSRLVPTVLLIVGLMCASWLSVKTGKVIENENKTVAQDTNKNRNEKSAYYSRKTITTYDAEGNPHEEVVESYGGDESLRSLIAIQPIAPIPPIPSIDFVIPPVPTIPDLNIMLPSFFKGDTIPAPARPYTGNLDNLSLEIEESIREHFKDFELQQRVLDEKLQSLTQDINAIIQKEISTEMQHSLAMAHEGEVVEQAINSQIQDQLMKLQDEHLKDLEIDMKHLNDNLRELEANMKAFQNELQKELVSDGYLKKGEKINKMEWNNGDIRINDITIKEKDKKKYNELHEKFFENSHGYHFRHVE